jgi:succinate-semialdehyde dehydrogenase/glutarate-semialdehyde dehydrogenase
MPFTAVDPTTGTHLYSVDALNADAREALLSRVHARQQGWRSRSIAERGRCMLALGDALARHREALAQALTREMGKPILSARAEVDKCVALCRSATPMAQSFLAPELLVDDGIAHVTLRYDALGTILAIMPWNFPYWQAMRFAVPTLLAGNGVIIKPAPSVPAAARALQRCFDEVRAQVDADLPCELGFIDIEDIDSTIADTRIVGVTLTASERAGRHVAQVAGAHLKKVVLELGGSDPFIVLPDADVARAAAAAVTARTVNSGQSCIAAKRFIVCETVYDQFLEKFVEGMRALVVGDPQDERTQIGPIATASVREGLAAQVRMSLRDGARALLGGDVNAYPGYFYPPTVLVDVPRHSAAACEELFGPVAAVFRVADIDDAVSLANASPYGLGASVWSTSASSAELVARALDVGMVFVNDIVVSDPRYPFGGVKLSGVGRELGPIGFREFTNLKSVRTLRPQTAPQ